MSADLAKHGAGSDQQMGHPPPSQWLCRKQLVLHKANTKQQYLCGSFVVIIPHAVEPHFSPTSRSYSNPPDELPANRKASRSQPSRWYISNVLFH